MLGGWCHQPSLGQLGLNREQGLGRGEGRYVERELASARKEKNTQKKALRPVRQIQGNVSRKD